ncbi:CBS domain-containing protein [Actinocorallia herbida]|uniref:CBS domain-containing protein n=1 Tax=Actinocorallia herbida TaxID=58109 RepID=A0A3N1CUV1_9ACTN|nr:CBS domain-containing protein [Actinocorallia herbida]ROO85076.1 CBS domain-containing protein [Actinocorallia herbida]
MQSSDPRDRRTVADAMLLSPKVHGRDTTVADAAVVLRNDHVHAVLVVDGAVLLAVVERGDLGAPPHLPARSAGRLGERVARPGDDLETARRAMAVAGRRRLAVVGEGDVLLGLLCLKRTGLGFCSDEGVEARAAERRAASAEDLAQTP